MKQKFLIIAICLSSMVWFPINGWARECCCNITCQYGSLGGQTWVETVNKCYNEGVLWACTRNDACNAERGLFDIYTGYGSGSCSWQSDDWCSLLYLY